MRHPLFAFLVFILSLNCLAAEVPIDVLPPAYEGQYKVEIECRDSDPSPRCKKLHGPARLVIVNTDTDDGVYVSICDPEFGFPKYAFTATQFEQQGTVIRGESHLTSRPAEFELALTGNKVLMWVREAEFQQDLKITGYLNASPGAFYTDAGPDSFPAPYELQGRFQAHAGTQGYLSVKKKLTSKPQALDGFMAAWVHPSGALIAFNDGIFRPERGVLNLVTYHHPAGPGVLKWSSALRTDRNGRRIWSVVAYSTANCSANSFEFSRE